MIEPEDFNPNLSCKLKNDNGSLVSFNGQSLSFRLLFNSFKCL